MSFGKRKYYLVSICLKVLCVLRINYWYSPLKIGQIYIATFTLLDMLYNIYFHIQKESWLALSRKRRTPPTKHVRLMQSTSRFSLYREVYLVGESSLLDLLGREIFICFRTLSKWNGYCFFGNYQKWFTISYPCYLCNKVGMLIIW